MKPGLPFPLSLRVTLFLQAALLMVIVRAPMAAQDQTEQQFIDTTNGAISAFASTLVMSNPNEVVMSGNLVYANGAIITQPVMPLSAVLQYVDGLKAAGVQRVDLNPAVTSINDAAATTAYDAVVAHIRELGLQLALNPQVVGGELGSNASFQDFQNMALQTYPALAARYQPDNFVIVHEPTTMNARLGSGGSIQDWDNFIRTVAPLIHSASPHTRLGAGGFYSSEENTYFVDFVTIPVLDFMTMDLYDYTNFIPLNGWVQLAHGAIDPTHPNGKGIYIEETWAPKFLPNPLPAGWQSNPAGLSAYEIVGDCNADFATMDATWLQVMTMWASAVGMEAITPFTTQAFFYYYQGPTAQGTSTFGLDQPLNPNFILSSLTEIQDGQLTSTAHAYQSLTTQYGIRQVTSVSSASYATLPSVFCPSGSSCFARTVVSPDELVSGFGADLANSSPPTDGTFPTTLGGTSATLVDSSNTGYQVPLYAVTPGQINYYVPGNVKTGPATLTVKSGDGTVTTGVVQVAPVMPGIYTINQNGQGTAAAIAVCAGTCSGWPNPGNGVFWQYTFTPGCTSGDCSTPITWGDSDTVVVEFYGTGVRHVSGLSGASATVNGQGATVQYAGASGYTGEDQINILMPQSVRHSGVVNVVLTLDGQTSNTVTLDLP